MLKVPGRNPCFRRVFHWLPQPKKAAAACGPPALAVAACGLALAFAAMPGQQVRGGRGFDMRVVDRADADCSLCHANEAASFAPSEDAGAGADAAPAQGQGKQEDVATGEKPQTDTGKASASNKDASSQKDQKDVSGEPSKDAAARGIGRCRRPALICFLVDPDQCTVCHGDTDALTEVHVNAKGTTRQRSARLKNAVNNEACLACHGKRRGAGRGHRRQHRPDRRAGAIGAAPTTSRRSPATTTRSPAPAATPSTRSTSPSATARAAITRAVLNATPAMRCSGPYGEQNRRQ